jgi:hypothetical protein
LTWDRKTQHEKSPLVLHSTSCIASPSATHRLVMAPQLDKSQNFDSVHSCARLTSSSGSMAVSHRAPVGSDWESKQDPLAGSMGCASASVQQAAASRAGLASARSLRPAHPPLSDKAAWRRHPCGGGLTVCRRRAPPSRAGSTHRGRDVPLPYRNRPQHARCLGKSSGTRSNTRAWGQKNAKFQEMVDGPAAGHTGPAARCHARPASHSVPLAA